MNVQQNECKTDHTVTKIVIYKYISVLISIFEAFTNYLMYCKKLWMGRCGKRLLLLRGKIKNYQSYINLEIHIEEDAINRT